MREAIRKLFWAAAVVFIFPVAGLADGGHLLRVVDRCPGQAIAGAVVTLDGETLPFDPQGLFSPDEDRWDRQGEGSRLPACRAGAARSAARRAVGSQADRSSARALYLSFYGVGSKALRGPAMKLIEETELNALVIDDLKGDRGMIPYRSSVPLAAEVGAQKIITVRDAEGLMTFFKEKGVYTIARIVVFKDNLLASARPELAVKTPTGEPWRDRENLAWVDPFRKEVWDYNIQIAVEAAKLGFDEIQFDYVRFPDSHSPRFSSPAPRRPG